MPWEPGILSSTQNIWSRACCWYVKERYGQQVALLVVERQAALCNDPIWGPSRQPYYRRVRDDIINPTLLAIVWFLPVVTWKNNLFVIKSMERGKISSCIAMGRITRVVLRYPFCGSMKETTLDYIILSEHWIDFKNIMCFMNEVTTEWIETHYVLGVRQYTL